MDDIEHLLFIICGYKRYCDECHKLMIWQLCADCGQCTLDGVFVSAETKQYYEFPKIKQLFI